MSDSARPEQRRLDAFAAVAAAVAHSRDLDAALGKALDITLSVLGLTAGGVYLLDEDTGELIVTAHHRGLPPEYPQAVARFRRGEGVIGRALDSVQPIAVRDLAAMSEAREATRRVGLRSMVFAPLYARGRAVGMMAVGGYEVRDFPPEELQLLGAVGGVLGAAVENDRLVERAHRHLEQVQALWEVDRAVVEDRSPAEVLDTIAREAARLAGGAAALVLLDGEREARVAASSGPEADAALGEPALSGNELRRRLRQPPEAAEAIDLAGGRKAIIVPLPAAGRTVAALVVVYRGRVEEQEWATLAGFGRRSAVALAKVEAHQAEARRAGQLQLLAGASQIAASTLDLDVLMDAIARFIQQAFGYYAVSVYLMSEGGGETVLAGAAGAAAAAMEAGHRIPCGRGMIGWVAEHGEHLLANDVRKEPRFFRGRLGATLSELAVPVRLDGEVVAVLNVESDRTDAFDEGDVMALDGVAAQVASAVQNARLFDEKIRAIRNLEILQEITNVLNSDLELDVLLERIARRSVEAVGPAKMGAVLLYDGGALTVRSSHGYAVEAPLLDVRMDFHEGLPGAVFVSGQGQLVRSSPEDYGRHRAAFDEACGGAERHSALCVPIALPDEKLGVLLLESTTAPDAFRAEDLRFAATLSHQAAIAIGNALRLQRIVEMDRQRQAYLSNVSHELRTPLTVVQGYIEALSGGVGAEQAQQYLRIAHEQSQRLARMIDEVLEVSRFEQGVAQRHVNWAPVALGATVEGVARAARQEASLREVAVEVQVAPGLPEIVGDERLLRLMVGHLVGNAVKFSPPGGVVLVEMDVAPSGEARLRVRDSGTGIAPEHHDRIFEKFFMADAGSTKARGGAGIGLYLVREVVAIHGGAIHVESTLGQGACFDVRLPIRPRA